MNRSSSPNKSSPERKGSLKSFGQKFQPVELLTPEQLLQTDLPDHEFSNAIYSALDTVPEIPFTYTYYKQDDPIAVPDDYPQEPNQKILRPEFFRKFDISTLLYIFFYFPGSIQQLYAAKELKSRGWRFHTKYQTWFYRVSKPKVINKDFEIADFDYFDRSGNEGWCIRRRIDFQLDYDCLELD